MPSKRWIGRALLAASAALLVLLTSALPSREARAQDLIERANESRKVPVRKKFSQNRVELSASAPLTRDEDTRRRLSVGLEARGDSSFLCGRFDALAGIKDLVTEDVSSRASQMLLDIAEGELVANGMTLLCQASPTLCDVLKHYRFSAQALLQLNCTVTLGWRGSSSRP